MKQFRDVMYMLLTVKYRGLSRARLNELINYFNIFLLLSITICISLYYLINICNIYRFFFTFEIQVN